MIEFKDIILLAAGAILGAVVSIVMTLLVEWLKQPRLRIEIDTSTTRTYPKGSPIGGNTATYLAIKILNQQLDPWLSWLQRSAAMDCHGYIYFRDLHGKIIGAKSMPLRWSHTSEPIPVIARRMQFPHQEIAKIYDNIRLTQERFVNLHPGKAPKRAPVAIQIHGEQETYGWSNHSYEFNSATRQENWRNPTWKMDQEIYEIEVIVEHRSGEHREKFYLINQPDIFKLRDSISDCTCPCITNKMCINPRY